MSEGAPFRLNKYISRTRFGGILLSICYTNKNYVEYYDGFFHMRHMEEAWNFNMTEGFNPSWINGLTESMMEQFTKYAPGFMCVGRKHHPFGHERHNICCGIMSILCSAQIVEGKYFSQQLVQKE